MPRFIIIVLCIFVPGGVFSQKKIPVKGVKGSASIEGDVSPNAAKLRALNEAKSSALREAGISENINTYQMLFTSSTSKDYNQFFSSNIQSEMQGAISSYTIISEQVQCITTVTLAPKEDQSSMKENKKSKERNESGGKNGDNINLLYDVIIDAEVIRYETEPDASFTDNIEGIKAVYNNNENLTFSVKASQDCHLTIFNITDQGAELLFPNSYEKNTRLKKLETVKFPQARIDYSLGSDTKKQETNRLIFVLTKTDIPFVKGDKEGKTNAENIFTWLYAIPPDQRRVEYFTLTILP